MATTEAATDYNWFELHSTATVEYDYTDDMCFKSSVIRFGEIFTPVFFSIVIILSLVGNVLVIVILSKFENICSLTNAFILNLALSDLFFTAGLPFWAYYHMYGWSLGEFACKSVNFIFYTGFYSSGFFLILMTAHRYVAVMRPLSDIVSATGLSSVIASIVVWALSMFAASPAYIFSTVKNVDYCTYTSSFWALWGTYQQNVLFSVSSLVFIFCYCQIICRLLLRPPTQRRKNKTLKLIFTLIVVFFVGWAPYNIVIFLQSVFPQMSLSMNPTERCDYSKSLDYALYITRLLAFSHCCLNPVFYVFVGVKFKNHLKKMLKSWGHKNNSITKSRPTITSQTSGEEFSM